MSIVSFWPIIGVPIFRSVFGWLEHSLKDHKIDKFEWAKLGETVVRVGVIGLGMYFGLSKFFGVDMNVLGVSAGALVFDFLISALKAKRKE